MRPSNAKIALSQERWNARMMSRRSSGSSRLESPVEPTMSQKTTVRFRRSALMARAADGDRSWLDNCATLAPFARRPNRRFIATLYHSFVTRPSRLAVDCPGLSDDHVGRLLRGHINRAQNKQAWNFRKN